MRIIDAPSLASLTTLRLGGRAIAMVCLEAQQDLEILPRTLSSLGGIPVVLGHGSNILAADGQLPVVLLRPWQWRTPSVQGTDSNGHVLVQADAAMPLPRLLAWAGKHGLSGLEALSGIPGEAGGALRMNAGSYGTSFCDAVAGATIFSPVLGTRFIARNNMQPQYRHNALPGDETIQVVLSVLLALTPDSSENIRKKMRDIMQRKVSTQPVRAWSAGCAFANPAGESAGRLLDNLGFRGRQSGGMAFSNMHANFLINTGTGTATQAFELIQAAKDAVRMTYGIELQLEIKVLPC